MCIRDRYQLMSPEEVVKQATDAKNAGAHSYCLVAAWREPSENEFEQGCHIIKEVNEKVGISIECSLGFLTINQAKKLKELGVIRYNHNLETSESKFPEICTTHTYQDRVDRRQRQMCIRDRVCHIIKEVNEKVGISIECSLGFLTIKQAKKLKDLGVVRYNHNLETSESKFHEICTTHTYQDRINTLHIAREAGLELCTGGIIGMGETRNQREELVQAIGRLHPEEVTVNLLVPFPGTPLELQTPLSLEEILRVFAILRFLLPKSIIKISGGREVNLKDDGKELLLSGANGIISAGYLTLDGNSMQKDVKMIEEIDLEA